MKKMVYISEDMMLEKNLFVWKITQTLVYYRSMLNENRQ